MSETNGKSSLLIGLNNGFIPQTYQKDLLGKQDQSSEREESQRDATLSEKSSERSVDFHHSK